MSAETSVESGADVSLTKARLVLRVLRSFG